MKRATVRVGWAHGLHLRPAPHLVRISQQFHAAIWLRCGPRRANLRSIISLISLCASMGTTLDLEAAGEDEDNAVQAVQHFFQSSDDGGPTDDDAPPPDARGPSGVTDRS